MKKYISKLWSLIPTPIVYVNKSKEVIDASQEFIRLVRKLTGKSLTKKKIIGQVITKLFDNKEINKLCEKAINQRKLTESITLIDAKGDKHFFNVTSIKHKIKKDFKGCFIAFDEITKLVNKSYDLNERVKELRAFYELSSLVEKAKSLEDIFKGIIDFLPDSFQHPDIAKAKIIVNDFKHSTKGFKRISKCISSSIKVNDKIIGKLIVCCPEEKGFLNEEQKLIDSLTERLGRIIERYQAQDKLEKERKKYQEQFNSAIDAILLADPETGIIIDCNKAACRLTGYSRKELIGMHQGKLHPKELVEGKFSKAFKEHLKKPGRLIDTKLKTKKGRVKDVQVKSSIIDLGKNKYLQGIFRDVTNQVRMQKKLEISEKKFRLITQNAGVGLVLSDSKGNIINFNNKASGIFGISRKKALNMKSWDLMSLFTDTPMSRKAMGMIKGSLKSGQVKGKRIETKITVGEKKKTVIVQVSVIKLSDDNWLLITVDDISERKRIEDELRDNEEHYRLLFENADDVIVELSRSLKIIDVNQQVKDLIGYSKKEIIGKRVTKLGFINQSNLKIVLKAISSAISGKEPDSVLEFELKHKNGSIIKVEASTQTIMKDEQIIGFMAIIRDVTERKRIERRLRLYKRNFEKSPNSKLLIEYRDKEPHIIEVNNSFTEMYGYESDEVLGENPRVLKSGEQDKEYYKKMWEAILDPKIGHWRDEIINKRKDGTEIPVILSISTLFNEDEPTYFIASHIDISERKRIEEKYRRIVENANEGIWVIDSETKTSFVNEQMANMFGYSVKEMIGKSMFYFMDEDNKKKAKKLFGERKKGIKERHEFEFRKKNGDRIYTSLSAAPIIIKGEFNGAIALVTDVTERKKIFDTLRESEKKHRLLFENSSDLIQNCSIDGEIIDVNEAWLDKMGYSKEEALKLNFKDYIHPEHIDSCEKMIKSLSKGKKIDFFETIFITKKGKKLFIEGSAQPVKKEGKVTSLWGILRDVTDQRLAQERKLEREKKEELARLRNIFLMRVSHELRHPLMPIIGFTEVLKERGLSGEEQKLVTKIMNNAKKLNNLVDNTVTILNLEIKKSVEKKKTNINSIINELLDDYNDELRQEDLEVNSKLEKNVKTRINQSLIKKALSNLISNSINYAKSKIYVRTKKSGNKVIIRVFDDGDGIPDKIIKDLEGGDYSFKQKLSGYQGMQLGLLLVNLIMKVHKGKLRFKRWRKKNIVELVLPHA